MAEQIERKEGSLSDLDIDEVSFVTRGANPGAHIVLLKRFDADDEEVEKCEGTDAESACNACGASGKRKKHVLTSEKDAIVEAEKALRASDSKEVLSAQLNKALQARYGYGAYCVATFKDSLIYTYMEKMWRVKFAVNDDVAEFMETPVEVEMSYVDKALRDRKINKILAGTAEQLSRIVKFNPYHSRDGKFAAGAGQKVRLALSSGTKDSLKAIRGKLKGKGYKERRIEDSVMFENGESRILVGRDGSWSHKVGGNYKKISHSGELAGYVNSI